MKILNNKKATEPISVFPFWMLYVVLTAISCVALVYLGTYFVAKAAEIPPNMEDELILASRFYNSEDCFAYQDDVGRVYTKVINSSEFTQKNMDKCFPKSEPSKVKYSYLLTLEQPPQGTDKIWTFKTLPITTFNYPEEGYAQKAISEDVLVLYEDKTYNGKLRIKIKDVE